ncbi:MAG: TIGR03364 family FAD-dependent oxidoreductase [Myxococcales bacterium]|nr:TIGR03364 family FAD-dependent oxidoreductase [Myxococcales bacterium]
MASADVVVVGAGIAGLGAALAAARSGRRVVVLERSGRPLGASVRNFGTIWPVGRRPGVAAARARRGRAVWDELRAATGLWADDSGSLHLAHADDEWAVLRDFAASADRAWFDVELLDAAAVRALAPAVRPDELRGGLYSRTELQVEPRSAIAALVDWLRRDFGVEVRFGEAVVGVDGGGATTADGTRWAAGHVFVCTGDDFRGLFPAAFRASGMVRSKLQMMRTVPQPAGWRQGPILVAGLTLIHYENFEASPALAGLRARYGEERGEYVARGIHVISSQHGDGSLVLGDSHEYGDEFSPDLSMAVDALVLAELSRWLDVPRLEIADRWFGTYAKAAGGANVWVERPAAGVTVMTGFGGAGMTLAFGTAEDVVAESLSG